jgi:hypothetical protein
MSTAHTITHNYRLPPYLLGKAASLPDFLLQRASEMVFLAMTQI